MLVQDSLPWAWKRKLRSTLDLMDAIMVYDEVLKIKKRSNGSCPVERGISEEGKAVRRGTIIDDVTKTRDLKGNQQLNAMNTTFQ